MKIRGPLLKLSIFIFLTTFVTLVLAKTIGNLDSRAKLRYAAEFTNITGLLPGDDIRIAGVTVGRVATEKVVADHALVEFTVDKDIRLRQSTKAAVRFRDLLGRRYIALIENAGDPSTLAPCTHRACEPIPLGQTSPALDLTELFNGFKPLFSALQPKDVNTLATEIIATLQGEGSTVDSLLSNTASLTNTLADRDQVIGRVVHNLNDLVGTIAQRDNKLSDLIVSLRDLAGGLATDRESIGGALAGIDKLASSTAGILHEARPPLDSDLRGLKTTTEILLANRKNLDLVLKRLPGGLAALTRATSYGSWLNLYVCGFAVDNGKGTVTPVNGANQHTPVCE
jgi:phospholipid/cholesterol/gamma-HCH transport system substrate-binding protein